MKYLVLFLLVSLSSGAEARQIRIAILDTGANVVSVPHLKLCHEGIIDLTGTDNKDEIGHGTNVAGIIADRLKDVDYCAIVIKMYSKTRNYYFNYLAALAYLFDLNVDIINFSSSGTHPLLSERLLIKAVLARGAVFVTAAGNEHHDLDKKCDAFPACIPGVISVGNLAEDGPHRTSNYGRVVSAWEPGVNLCGGGICMTGTSQATGVHTARLARKMYLNSIK